MPNQEKQLSTDADLGVKVRVLSGVLYFVTSLLLCVFFTRGSASSAPSSCYSILSDSPADS
jgi:hypothetical protein